MSKGLRNFHRGERAVQLRAEVPAKYSEMASSVIRTEMPDQHRGFFESLPVLFMGFVDHGGRVWASPFIGGENSIHSPLPDQLNIDGLPLLVDELGLDLTVGAKVGAVGIQQDTRRRNRVNGTITQHTNKGLLMRVDQSFGNCPKYIQLRHPKWNGPTNQKITSTKLSNLNTTAKAMIATADTFIIASRHAVLSDAPTAGVDASHRGGRSGFLKVDSAGALSFPDFSGNRFFNTLGNIVDDGRVGMFIPDFASGSALFITGRAVIEWGRDHVAAFKGAERLIHVTPEEIWLAHGLVVAGDDTVEPSPHLQRTGIWEEKH
ncbi:hypothetical protein GCM10007939_22860 [Amylibacter marinus]|uniref:Pyridoxamine 5'-phosphate oxidase putative domain-containing protein n=1 Tax=Amylibacter marinus TaxID=1475483 RepID=A0ABQ5VXR5_9RHOB|nr:pyridoxamine 5'-phosphate oxidase family protein [Amylibacter marinus]GLQ36002.1 hypothetical protein GCM10007939_22860 [Amylibacter marinus]